MEISKNACSLAKIEGTVLAEAKEEGTRLPAGPAAGQGGAAAALPTFPLGRSWLLLEGSKKVLGGSPFSCLAQELAEAIYISWGDLEHKV